MDSRQFDNLTKALATATSRRQALRRIAGILGGTALAGLFPGLTFASNSDCAHFCNAVFGGDTPASAQCASDGAHGRGLCHTCGSVDPSSICCSRNSSGFCSSYSGATCCGSSATCLNGSCCATANVCGSTCLAAPCASNQCLTCDPSSGTCISRCSSEQGCCNGTCTALNTTQNCGSCGITCTGTTPACCSGHCRDLSNDVNNCGSCGHVCGGGQTCQNGTCGGVSCSFVCPPTDLALRPLQSQSITSTEVFCRYQTVPNDFFCRYFASNGLLKQDHDNGFCPPVAIPNCSV